MSPSLGLQTSSSEGGAQVLIPKPRWIEGALPGAFPSGDKMSEVMPDDFHSGRCASLLVQEREILLNRRMHVLSFLAGAGPSLLFYHSPTDSASCGNKKIQINLKRDPSLSLIVDDPQTRQSVVAYG